MAAARGHDPRVLPSLEQRLLRLLAREECDELRAHRELRAQPIDLRVLEGECIQGAVFAGEFAGVWQFEVADNGSKFRPGDPLLAGDGIDLEAGVPMVCGHYDAQRGILFCEPDTLGRHDAELVPGRAYVVDRRPLGLQGRLRDAVRAAFATPDLAAVLRGEHRVRRDEARHARALQRLAALGLDDAQVQAGAAAIATESLQLVQGPPGTGKTRLLAAVCGLLGAYSCRVALSAFTHRAVGNALLAIRRQAPQVPVYKLATSTSEGDDELRGAGVRFIDPRRLRVREPGAVIAGTCFQLAKLPDREAFHYAVFDEAGQLPIPHALPAMLRSRRWLFFGDHRQLPPVVATAAADREVAVSIFELLHDRYGSVLLDTTYRMNAGVCRLVSDTFYGGRLRPAPGAAERAMPFEPGGAFDDVLTPARPVVWLRIDHQHPGSRSPEEATAIADVVDEIVRRHRVPPEAIAVIAPFRAQARLLRSAIEHKGVPGQASLAVDTVERIQGQEREVVIVSLTVGDPVAAKGRGAFHLSLNRLNVALSRARTKAILVASAHAFRALPHDAEGLRMASRCRELRDHLPCVDWTRLYAAASR